MDVWGAVAAERSELADLGESLTEEQWEAPSLCAHWSVRQTFAHVVAGAAGAGIGTFLAYLVLTGLNANRAIERATIRFADRAGTRDLVDQLRRNAESRKRPPGSTANGLLAEVIVHGQDIRRPLGIRRVPPVDRTTDALWSMVRTGSVLGNVGRIAGLRLVATDTEWSYGEGPEVRGPAEALLMATCGRRVAFDELGRSGTRHAANALTSAGVTESAAAAPARRRSRRAA